MHPSLGPAERGLQPLRLPPGVDLRGALEQATRHRDMPAFVALADARGRVHGGHVVLGNVARTTAELLLAWLSGWDLGREFDPQTGCAELVLRAASKGAERP